MANQGGIRNVSLWYDIGYTDGCTEIPPIGHTLRAPDITLQGEFHPAWDRLFSQLEVPETFPDLMKCSYIRMEFFYNNSQDSNLYYGWIDEVVLRSDTQGQPVTWIKWHVDWWRTYNSLMTFGSGYVLRRPTTDCDFWQNYPYRYLEIDRLIKINNSDEWLCWWAVVSVVTTNDNITALRWYYFPIGARGGHWRIKQVDNEVYCPSPLQLADGSVLSVLGFDPKSVQGIWLVPYDLITDDITIDRSPSVLTVFLRAASDYFAIYEHTSGSMKYGVLTDANSSSARFPPAAHRTNVGAVSTERHPIKILDNLGSTVGAVPFGMMLNYVDMEAVISDSGIYLMCTANMSDRYKANACGLQWMIMCPMLPINSNEWSSYTYSGRRQFDIEQRNIKTLSSTIENSASTLIGGALVGGMVGSAGGPIGIGTGALVGAAAGIVKGLIDTTVVNDRYQNIEDHYHASQANAVIVPGDGTLSVTYEYNLRDYYVAVLRMDAESDAFIADNEDTSGVRFGVNVSDCTSLITVGGPMQISNLIVHGNIPVQAKNWTRRKFADGVRIIARPTEDNDVEDT